MIFRRGRRWRRKGELARKVVFTFNGDETTVVVSASHVDLKRESDDGDNVVVLRMQRSRGISLDLSNAELAAADVSTAR